MLTTGGLLAFARLTMFAHLQSQLSLHVRTHVIQTTSSVHQCYNCSEMLLHHIRFPKDVDPASARHMWHERKTLLDYVGRRYGFSVLAKQHYNRE